MNRCVLCGGRARYGSELPSGQRVCATCELDWERVPGFVMTGRSYTFHTDEDCLSIRCGLGQKRARGKMGSKGSHYVNVRPKRLGQVPHYEVCGRCGHEANPPRPDPRARLRATGGEAGTD